MAFIAFIAGAGAAAAFLAFFIAFIAFMAFGMVKIERMRAWETLDLTNSDKDTRMTSHSNDSQNATPY